MADVQTVLDDCDKEYDTGLRSNILAHQNQFKSDNGRYQQLLPTHSTIPADGVKLTPDNVAKPSDEEEGWPQSMTNLALLQCVTCHKYQAPEDYGFLIMREVQINEDHYLTVEDTVGLVGGRDWARVLPIGMEEGA